MLDFCRSVSPHFLSFHPLTWIFSTCHKKGVREFSLTGIEARGSKSRRLRLLAKLPNQYTVSRLVSVHNMRAQQQQKPDRRKEDRVPGVAEGEKAAACSTAASATAAAMTALIQDFILHNNHTRVTAPLNNHAAADPEGSKNTIRVRF